MRRNCQIIFSSSFVDAESIVVEVLKEHFKLLEVSVREILKDQIKKKSELLTQEINDYINRNELIPTYLMSKLIEQAIDRIPSGGIIIRYYPRTIEQYISLKELLMQRGFVITRLWYLRIDNPESLPRYSSNYRENYEDLKRFINNPDISEEIYFKYPVKNNEEELVRNVKSALDGF